MNGFWPLPVEHHQHKLQAVHANIQQSASAQLLLHRARDVQLRGAKVGLYQLHLTYCLLSQQPAHLSMHRETAGPDALTGTEQTVYSGVTPEQQFITTSCMSTVADVLVKHDVTRCFPLT